MDKATAIKEAVTCKQFADFIGLSVNRSGFAVCPFHGDKDASLKIYKNGRGWCCFGCHKGGDVINLAGLWYGTGFKETLKRLNDDFDLGIISDNAETAENAVSVAVEIAKRKTARLKAERLKAALEAEYWNVFDKWFQADRAVLENEPVPPDYEFTEGFCEALKNRDIYRERLEYLEMRRISCNG